MPLSILWLGYIWFSVCSRNVGCGTGLQSCSKQEIMRSSGVTSQNIRELSFLSGGGRLFVMDGQEFFWSPYAILELTATKKILVPLSTVKKNWSPLWLPQKILVPPQTDGPPPGKKWLLPKVNVLRIFVLWLLSMSFHMHEYSFLQVIRYNYAFCLHLESTCYFTIIFCN